MPISCEMIDYAGAKACQTMIHTNATGLTEEMSERLLSSSLTFLSFSFDGCSPEVYEHLRRRRSLSRSDPISAGYLDLRRRHGRGPHTTIEIIRMRDTDSLIQSFVEEWKTSGVDEVRVVPYLTWHGLVDDRHVESRPQVPLFKPCAAPFQHGCILSDGTAVPCCLDVNGQMPLGDITKSRFRDIWLNRSYRRLRLQMLTGTLPPDSICEHCDNTIREPESLPAILPERLRPNS